MKTVMLAFGTRPEAVKMAPLAMELRKYPDMFRTVVCVTGQHRELLDQVLALFGIMPDYDLNIMKSGQDLYDITSRIMSGMRDVLKESEPDIVLVHGDTSSSTACALSAFYRQIPVGHVEAGLRTYDIYAPWPEEMNRQLNSRLATWHFAPTLRCKENLLRENIPADRIAVTGNTAIDTLHLVSSRLENDTDLEAGQVSAITEAGYDVSRLDGGKKLVLITCHRRENTGLDFTNICSSVKTLADRYPHVDFVYTLHPNPAVREPLKRFFGENLSVCPNLFFIEPLEYLSFIYLLKRSALVLTDSGGIQEEAPVFGKPVLVMQKHSSRPEAIEAGTARHVGTDRDRIVGETSRLLDDEETYAAMSRAANPYGDGHACERIVGSLVRIFGWNC